MSFNYTGDPNNINLGNIYNQSALPIDGETAFAQTVTTPLVSTMDHFHYFGRTMASIPARFTVWSHNLNAGGASEIIIAPFKDVWIFNGNKWFPITKTSNTVVTVLNKEGGGNFGVAIGQFYYIYLKSDGSFVISSDLPDASLTNKNSLAADYLQFRYVAAIKPISASAVMTFSMVGGDYTVNEHLVTSSSLLPFRPAGFDTYELFGAFNITPWARTIKLEIKYQIATLAGNGALPEAPACNLAIRMRGTNSIIKYPLYSQTGAENKSGRMFSFDQIYGGNLLDLAYTDKNNITNPTINDIELYINGKGWKD